MLEIPRFIAEEYLVVDENGWKLKEDAPQWAVEEFYEFINLFDLIYQDEPEN